MKLQSIRIKNENKFLKGIKIDFVPNTKRKDNMSQIEDGVFNYVSIFGRNASGKTSIINNIITYFSNIDQGALARKEQNMFLHNFNSENEFFLNNLSQTNIKDNVDDKITKIIKEQSSHNPSYKVVFKFSSGKSMTHSMKIQTIGEVQTSVEEIKINGLSYEIDNHNIMGGSSLFQYFMTKNINDNSELTKEEINEFSSYINNTLKNIYLSNARWSKEITSQLDEWTKNVEIEKQEALMYYAKKLDRNLIGIHKNTIDDTYYALVESGGETIRISIDSLSAGTRSSLVYFIRILNIGLSTHGGLMIQDEIEARVHDEITKDMLGVINHFNLKTQVLFTSHAPRIFDGWLRHDSANFIENNNNVLTLRNVADEYRERSDKLLSAIARDKGFMSPGGN